MALSPGTRLGPYEILEPLGAGGMGEVYRATDTRLDRTVAVKVLPAELSQSPERRQRFEREARAVSSLNHPHICTLYDVGHEGGVDFLVMEHIEGETLADRLKKGELPLDRALKHGIEIADALDKAHRHGVIHRDLKPGNIMLTKSGAKLLDFGLAKLQEGTDGAPALSQLPTREKPLTSEGTVLGTFQYMSPEQLEGKEAGARTDIFAFGAVLYEMLTGRRAFEGKTQASLIAAILEHDPPALTELQPMTPPLLDRLVRRCLEKDPDERWQSAGDLAADLRWIAEGLGVSDGTMARARARWTRERLVWAGLATALTVALTVILARGVDVTPAGSFPDPPLRRFTVTPRALTNNRTLLLRVAVISNDGRHIAYTEGEPPDSSLWVHDLEREQARELQGAEGAFSPFWSPTSDFIGFFSMTGELKKVSTHGGAVATLCELPGPRLGRTFLTSSGSWSADGRSVVFGYHGKIHQVPSRGGAPTILIERPDDDPPKELRYPHLPSVRGLAPALFFSACTSLLSSDCHVVVQHLETGVQRVLGPGLGPAFSPTGHVLFSSLPDRVVFAQPFSLNTLQPTGRAFPVAENAFGPSVASDGTLVYAGGSGAPPQIQIVRRDRRGEALGSVGRPDAWLGLPRLSPDGRRVAATAGDIWIHDVHRPIKSRLTFGGEHGFFLWPTWSPAGDRLAFSATGSGDIHVMAVEGVAESEVLVATPHQDYLEDWSPDGRYVLFSRQDPKTEEQDLWYVELAAKQGRSEPVRFVERPEVQHLAEFSPDGRYVAYLSRESGRSEVYVERFPDGGDRVQVSSEGASQLRWGRSEIFYVKHAGQGATAAPPLDRGTLVAVPLTTAPTFGVDTPQQLFRSPGLVGPQFGAMYDVSADGQTFFIAEPVGESSPPVIRVVQNWFEEFAGHDKGPEQ